MIINSNLLKIFLNCLLQRVARLKARLFLYHVTHWSTSDPSRHVQSYVKYAVQPIRAGDYQDTSNHSFWQNCCIFQTSSTSIKIRSRKLQFCRDFIFSQRLYLMYTLQIIFYVFESNFNCLNIFAQNRTKMG